MTIVVPNGSSTHADMVHRHVKRTLENLAANNIELSEEDLKEVGHVMSTHEILGDRYYGATPAEMHLCG